MTIPRLPPSFHRPEIPQRNLPRRLIDNLRFRKCKSFRSLSIKIKGEVGLATYCARKREKDYALSRASSFSSAEAIENESNKGSGFRVGRVKFALALRVKKVLKQFPKHEWVEAFLDQLHVTVQMRRLLSVKFRRRGFREADILDLTNGDLVAMGIAPYERGEILGVVADLNHQGPGIH